VNDQVRDQIMVKAGVTPDQGGGPEARDADAAHGGARSAQGQTTSKEVLRVTQMDTF
jgi:hypothetical protein